MSEFLVACRSVDQHDHRPLITITATSTLDIAKSFIYQLMHNRVALKRILKFPLKQLLHVSVQSPSAGSVLFELAKVIVIKMIS